MVHVKLTEQLIEAIAGTREADTQPAFAVARQGLLDYLGAAWLGRAQPETARLLPYVGGTGDALLLGTAQGATAELSALFNGYLGHYLDYDDVNPTVRGHTSAVLYPALLAVASLRKVTGRRFLAAYVIGVEVMARLARAMGRQHYLRGFHSTATLGVPAAAMAAGYLLRLDGNTLLHAMGLAAAQMSGLRLHFGTEGKPLQAGFAAQKGLQAALLAEAGIKAGRDVLESAQGVLALYGEGVSVDTRELLLGKWGRSWELCSGGLLLKQYPCCSGAAHVAEAARRLYQAGNFSPAQVEKVALIFPPGGDAALTYRQPTTGEEGRFSAEYVAALGLSGLPYTLENFSPKRIPDTLQQMMARIQRQLDAAIVPLETAMPPGRFAIVRVYLQDGRRLEERVDTPKGSPGNPLTAEEQRQKLLRCCPAEVAERLLSAVGGLADAQDLGALIQVLKTDARKASESDKE